MRSSALPAATSQARRRTAAPAAASSTAARAETTPAMTERKVLSRDSSACSRSAFAARTSATERKPLKRSQVPRKPQSKLCFGGFITSLPVKLHCPNTERFGRNSQNARRTAFSFITT